MGVQAVLTVILFVTIDTMPNIDGDFDGHCNGDSPLTSIYFTSIVRLFPLCDCDYDVTAAVLAL